MAIIEVAPGTFWVVKEKGATFVVNTKKRTVTCGHTCVVTDEETAPECVGCCGKSAKKVVKLATVPELPSALKKFIARVEGSGASGDGEWVPRCDNGACSCELVTFHGPAPKPGESMKMGKKKLASSSSVKQTRGKAAGSSARAAKPRRRQPRRSSKA